jgi:glutathione S-transferase
MLTLHKFAPMLGAPDASPFCIKLEMFLKLAHLPYERQPADLAEAPKGKAPYVRDGERLIGDSELIMLRLERRHGIDLDAGLDPAARAAGHAFCRMLEERTYFAIVFNRWHEDDNWPVERRHVLGDLSDQVCDAIRAESARTLRLHGLGRHTPEEIYELAAADIEALARWLGTKPFFQGERPARADCTVGAFLIAMLTEGFRSPLAEAVRRHGNLVAYHRRVMRLLFPDLA